MKKYFRIVISIAFAAFLIAAFLVACKPVEPVERGSSNTKIYFEQGGSKMVVDSGGEIEVASGGTLNVDGTLEVAGEFQYGDDSLYPVGMSESGYQVVLGTSEITGTATAAHGLTTVTWALCTLAEDPTAGAGDAAYCTVSVSGNTVTIKAWQDDFVTAATETDVAINWLVIGKP